LPSIAGAQKDLGPPRNNLDKRDVLIGLAMLELAGLISDPASRKAMERSSATLMRNATEKIAEEIEQR
jgi:hypothetical protein